ncbi:Uncharacterised protein [Vibrio cholerae]|nr:Uncharacterised protein [Vibrio cholerae]
MLTIFGLVNAPIFKMVRYCMSLTKMPKTRMGIRYALGMM